MVLFQSIDSRIFSLFSFSGEIERKKNERLTRMGECNFILFHSLLALYTLKDPYRPNI